MSVFTRLTVEIEDVFCVFGFLKQQLLNRDSTFTGHATSNTAETAFNRTLTCEYV